MIYLNSKSFFYSVSALALLCFFASSDTWALVADEEGKKLSSGPLQPRTGEMDDVKGMRAPVAADGRVAAKPEDSHANSAPAAAAGAAKAGEVDNRSSLRPVSAAAAAGGGAAAPSRVASQITVSSDLYERGKFLFARGNFQETVKVFFQLSQKNDFRGAFYLRYIRREHPKMLNATQENELARAEAFLMLVDPTQDPERIKKRANAKKGFDDYSKELKERDAAKAQFAEAKSLKEILKLIYLFRDDILKRDWDGNLVIEVSHRDQTEGRLYRMLAKIPHVEEKFKNDVGRVIHNLGVLIREGKINEDENEQHIKPAQRNEVAARLFRRAINGGFQGAANNLGVLIVEGKTNKDENGQRIEEAQRNEIAAGLFRRAINDGHQGARNNLGALIMGGKTNKDENEQHIEEAQRNEVAAGLFRRAINDGHQDAVSNLGVLIVGGKTNKNENGQHIEEAQRNEVAAGLFRRADNAGNIAATYNLGVIYSLNSNTYPQALECFTKALEGGFLAAIAPLSQLKEKMQNLKVAQAAPATAVVEKPTSAVTEPAKGVSATAAAGAALLKMEAAGAAVSTVDVKDDVALKDVHPADSTPAAAAGAGADAKLTKKLPGEISSDDEKDESVETQQSPESNKKEERRHKEKRKAHEKKLKEQEEVFKKLLARVELTAAETGKLFMPSDPSSQVKIRWEGNSLGEFRGLPLRQTRKVQLLVEAIKEGDNRYGAPECLKGSLKGWMSRRIDGKNRLVYKYDESQGIVIIYACKGHYE